MGDSLPAGWHIQLVEQIAASEDRAIAIGPFGSSLTSAMYALTGVPVIRGKDIGDGNVIRDDDLAFVPQDTADQFPGCMVRKGDLVFPHRGAIGRVGLIGDREYLLSSSMMKLSCNREIADPTYVFYYFRATGREELLSRASTVGTPGIGQPLRSLRGIPVVLPPIAEQQAIAEVLGALDDKIAANDRLVATTLNLDDAESTAAVMRSSRSELLENLAAVVKGVSYRRVDLDESSTALVTLKSIGRDGRFARRGFKPYIGDHRESQVVAQGDILVAQTDLTQAAEVIGWAVRTPDISTYDTLVASLDLAVVRPLPTVPGEYLLGALRQRSFRRHCQERMSGTTVLHLGRRAIEAYEVPLLPQDEMQTLAERTRTRHALVDELSRETELLAASRDELLPLLMSEKIRVRDAEKVVEEAT